MSQDSFLQLAALTRAVASSRNLARVLSGADIPKSAKRSLVDDVTKGSLDGSVLDSLVAAIAASDNGAAAAMVELTTRSAFDSVDDSLSFETTLYEVGKLIDDNVELRQALSDFAVDDDDKAALLRDLLGGKVAPAAIELAVTYIYVDHGRGVSKQLIESARAAAARRNTVIADVRTAVEIDDARRDALTSALQANFGTSVQTRFSVDPSIVGSVVVRVGDEVLDGSIRHRLEQARKAMAS